ncbi:hypothetical protein HAX54_028801 [Datura stramonium]|uniref:Uncharacterized protein n=1 Tax=Datura stramonium TaxID=4076 RepID=A0ABS8V5L4_DATST|nr:hypothetical protein [Datura stramonium]
MGTFVCSWWPDFGSASFVVLDMEEEWQRSYQKLASGGRHGAVNNAVSREEGKRRNGDGEWCVGSAVAAGDEGWCDVQVERRNEWREAAVKLVKSELFFRAFWVWEVWLD